MFAQLVAAADARHMFFLVASMRVYRPIVKLNYPMGLAFTRQANIPPPFSFYQSFYPFKSSGGYKGNGEPIGYNVPSTRKNPGIGSPLTFFLDPRLFG